MTGAGAHPSGAIVSEITVGDVTVTLCDSAPGSEPTGGSGGAAMLVHGTGGSTATDYWALYPMLAAVRRTIGLDLTPGARPTVDGLARQVRSAIDGAAGGPVHLIGYSLGAVVAAKAAAETPELTATLTLINGWRRTDRHQQLRNRAWRTLLAEGSQAFGDLTLATAHAPVFLRELPEYQLQSLYERRRARRDPRAELELNASIDITDALGRITAPTLVIGSRSDAMVPVHHSRELFGAIENARYLEIDAGHAALSERPAEIFAAIEDHIGSPRAVPAGTVLPGYQA
ncbi:alpha/beta hydrolase [Ruania alkalisoli]|uniref:Alpha/beta hydrolase n=1 Tax=Ruania alkalisoli TaxID=2779775 RepID=A0A7M1SXE3_9MICO|nr:alpha/beta hydrolase [Ruania alkalisoli]QOR71624.1 alpha/beta hydrolase [Ruania alkalisoli]